MTRAAPPWLAGQTEAFQLAVKGAPLEASLGALVRTVVEQADADVRCAFYLANAGRTELVHVTGMPDSYAECVDGFRIGPDSLACGLAVATSRPVITPAVTKEPRWEPWLWLAERYDFRAVSSFPLEPAPGDVIGTFAMYFRAPREASARDHESAAVPTRAAAIIVSRTREAEERARAEAALRENEWRQTFPLRLGDTLRPLADAATIQAEAARLLGERLGANQVHYGETIADTGDEATVVIRQGYGDGLPPMVGTFRHRAEGWGERLLATYRAGVTAVSDDVTTDPTITAAEAAVITSAGFRAYVAVPLLEAGQWVATLAVHCIAPRAWTADEVTLVEETAERTAERDALRRQLAEAEEAERRRLARELHDQLGQDLTAVRLGLEDALRLASSPSDGPGDASPLTARLAKLQTLAARMTGRARAIALEIRPPELDDVGLERALASHVDEWAARYGVHAELAVTGLAGRALPGDVGSTLYRIAREALTNVAKHARARQVSVIVEHPDGEVGLIVEDDGRAFDVEATGERARRERRHGLAGMRERAAIVSAEEHVPWAAPPRRGAAARRGVPGASGAAPRVERPRCPIAS